MGCTLHAGDITGDSINIIHLSRVEDMGCNNAG